jgi:hypothetical protein
MNGRDELLRLVTDLRPAQLDELADDSYARRRDHDLARTATRFPQGPSSARRRLPAGYGRPRRYLLPSAIAAIAAAVAVAVAVSGAFPGSRPRQVASAADAQHFLKASGAIAAQAPATTGAYWYVKERSFSPSLTIDNKSYGAVVAETDESWTGQVHDSQTYDEDVSFSFASAADEARWQAAGRPPLSTIYGQPFGRTKPWTRYFLGLGYAAPGYSGEFSLHQMQRLPATEAGLRALLLRLWNGPDETYLRQGMRGPGRPTYNTFLVEWAESILSGPTAPGTKAAIYQLLAGQPGLKIIDSVTDPLGRTGVAVSFGAVTMEVAGQRYRSYLLIDPKTAQLLAIATNPVRAGSVISPAQGGGVTVFEETGWTGKIGVSPPA